MIWLLVLPIIIGLPGGMGGPYGANPPPVNCVAQSYKDTNGTTQYAGAECFPSQVGMCPAESSPIDPVSNGADKTGATDSSGALCTSLSSGDVLFSTPGTYLLNATSGSCATTHGLVLPAGRKLECVPGVTLKRTANATTDTGMLYGSNGSNTICGCDMQGTNVTAPQIINTSSGFAAIEINGGAHYIIEDNTFEYWSRDAVIIETVNYSSASQISDLNVLWNSFRHNPYYTNVFDGNVQTSLIAHNFGINNEEGAEWDACTNQSIGTNITITDNMVTTDTVGACGTDAQGCQSPGFQAYYSPSNTCNYSGITITENYCKGTTQIPAAYHNSPSGGGSPTVVNNVRGTNCTCDVGGTC